MKVFSKSIHSLMLIFCFTTAFTSAACAGSEKTGNAPQQQDTSITGRLSLADNYMVVDEQRLDARTAKIFGETYQFFQQRSLASKQALRSMFLKNYRYKKLADQAVKDKHDGIKQENKDREKIKSEEAKQEKEENSLGDALLMDALIDEAVIAENTEDDEENAARQADAFPPAPAIPATAPVTAPPDTAVTDTENQYEAQQPSVDADGDQDKKAWYVFLVMNGSEHTVRHLPKGYAVTAYSSTSAVIDGSAGVKVLHDGKDVVIGGVKYMVMIIPDKGAAMPPITANCCINKDDAFSTAF